MLFVFNLFVFICFNLIWFYLFYCSFVVSVSPPDFQVYYSSWHLLGFVQCFQEIEACLMISLPLALNLYFFLQEIDFFSFFLGGM